MTINDIGPRPNAFDIEEATRRNENYRSVAWTGKYLQVTLMSIPVGESIGLEVHQDTDQFLRLDAGQGRAVMGPANSSQPTVDRSPCTRAPCPCQLHQASTTAATGASIKVSSVSPSSAPSTATLRNRP